MEIVVFVFDKLVMNRYDRVMTDLKLLVSATSTTRTEKILFLTWKNKLVFPTSIDFFYINIFLNWFSTLTVYSIKGLFLLSLKKNIILFCNVTGTEINLHFWEWAVYLKGLTHDEPSSQADLLSQRILVQTTLTRKVTVKFSGQVTIEVFF